MYALGVFFSPVIILATGFFVLFAVDEKKERQKAKEKAEKEKKETYIMNHPYVPPMFDESVRMKDTLAVLQKEKEWLSTNEYHAITTTIPNDIDALLKPYHALENKTASKKDVESALSSLQKQIHQIKKSVEEKKREAVLRRTTIIKHR